MDQQATTEARPLYRTVAAIGLAAHALSSIVHVALTQDPFFMVTLVVAAVAAGVVWSWRNGIWVGLVAGLALEVVTFWFVFPMMQGFTVSALDFAPALIGFIGVWSAIIASILGVVRRRAPREFTDSTKSKVLVAAGVVVVLVLASTALTLSNKETVTDAEATGATTILMHDGDKFSPDEVEVSGDEPTRLLLRNDDPFAHTFTIDDEGYDINEVFGPGSEKIVTFTPEGDGRVEFVCEFHADMKGTLVVS